MNISLLEITSSEKFYHFHAIFNLIKSAGSLVKTLKYGVLTGVCAFLFQLMVI
jgi:hypothetical protein